MPRRRNAVIPFDKKKRAALKFIKEVLDGFVEIETSITALHDDLKIEQDLFNPDEYVFLDELLDALASRVEDDLADLNEYFDLE